MRLLAFEEARVLEVANRIADEHLGARGTAAGRGHRPVAPGDRRFGRDGVPGAPPQQGRRRHDGPAPRRACTGTATCDHATAASTSAPADRARWRWWWRSRDRDVVGARE